MYLGNYVHFAMQQSIVSEEQQILLTLPNSTLGSQKRNLFSWYFVSGLLIVAY